MGNARQLEEIEVNHYLHNHLKPRGAEVTTTRSKCFGSSDWTETDARELEKLEAFVSKLYREYVCFLRDTKIPEHGFTPETEAAAYAFLYARGPLSDQIKGLKSRREHQRMLARQRRERLERVRELAQQRKLERERELERQHQRHRDTNQIFWRRASRWISRRLYVGKKWKAPTLLDAASMENEKATRR
jgi:hypothetical protein